jgi:hypothetical protein
MSHSPVISALPVDAVEGEVNGSHLPSPTSYVLPHAPLATSLSVSGYTLDSTDVGLPANLFTTNMKERGPTKADSVVASIPPSLNGTRLPSDPLFYAEDAVINPDASYLWAPKRFVPAGGVDFMAPPFTLSNSTDSVSSTGSFSNHFANGDTPFKGNALSTSSALGVTVSPRQRQNLTQTGNSPDVVYPDFLAGDADFPTVELKPTLTFDDMFSDIKKDGLVSFLKILENANSDGTSILDLTTLLRRHIANRAAAPPAVKDWNHELQSLLDMEPSEEKYLKLRELAHDFNLTAEVYAKILISELFLSPNEKTIPPSTIGGLAGGTKFICQGILFKFAVDVQLPDTPFWMYGKTSAATEYAMKAAGSELRHIVALSNALGDTDLRLPLMALIDYRGFRLVASSILPIGTHTIVYGSDNAGFNVYADPTVSDMFDIVAKRMNLKKHKFGDVELSGPVDIEIHKGEDNRHYIIDVARLFPPEAPDLALSPHPRSNYFKMLRPCLVFKYSTPLSSDAFSGFGRHNEEIHNAEVWLATKYMLDVLIPNLAQVLNEGNNRVKTSQQLSQMLHKAGINLRYLGLLRTHLKETNPSQDSPPLGSSMSGSTSQLPNYAGPIVGVGSGASQISGTSFYHYNNSLSHGGTPPQDSILLQSCEQSSLASSRASDSFSGANTRSPNTFQRRSVAIGMEYALRDSHPASNGQTESPPVSPRDRSYSLSISGKQSTLASDNSEGGFQIGGSSILADRSDIPNSLSGSLHLHASTKKAHSASSTGVVSSQDETSYPSSQSSTPTTSHSSQSSSKHKRRNAKSKSVDRSSEKRNTPVQRLSTAQISIHSLHSVATETSSSSPAPPLGSSVGLGIGGNSSSNLFATSGTPHSNSSGSSGDGTKDCHSTNGLHGSVTPISGSMAQLPPFSPENGRKSTGTVRQVVLREMIARTLKSKLRQSWRRTMQSHRISIEAPFADAALHLLNTVFYKLGDASESYWKHNMVADLVSKYSVGLTEEELSGHISLYHTIDGYMLFKTFTAMVGIRINWTPEQLYHCDRRFLYTDIESIDCIVRPMNIVTISEGILLSMMAATETDPSQRLDLLNMAETHLEAAYSALFNPLATTELGHVRYARMFVGNVEGRQKDAEAAFVCYVEAVMQHKHEMDSESSVPVLERTGSLGTSKTFLHTTLLRLLELALIHLSGSQNLVRLARCADASELHVSLSRWLGWLYKTHPGSSKDGINQVMELLRHVFTSAMGFPLLLNSLKYAPKKLMDAIRMDLLQVTALELPNQPRIFGHGETSLAHLFEMCCESDPNFWMPQVQTLDLTDVYTLTDNHLRQILPFCPNILSLKLGGCYRLTSKLAEVIALNRLRPLQYLSLAQCYSITDDFFLEIIPLLHSLKYLDISDCPLLTETSLFVLSRRAQQLSWILLNGCNGITNFGTLEHFCNLEALEVSRCTSVTSAQIAMFLRPGSPMQRLNLSCNAQIDDTVFIGISGPTSLTDVRVAETSVTASTMEVLIQFARGLTAIDISDCPKLSLDALGDKLGVFTHLRLLHTRGQANFSAGALFTAARQSLTVLDISRSSHSVQSVLIKSTPPSLTTLNISRCNEFIANSLLELGSLANLTQLNVGGCVNMTDSVLKAILERLRFLTRLEVASCSQLTAGICPIIARYCPQLRLLDLESCVGIDQPKFNELGYSCQELNELRLSRICLKNPSAMKTLFRGSLSSLRIVKLKECMLGDDSLREIAHHSPSLMELDLSDNPEISTSAVKHLFQQCHYLQTVLLAGVHTITDDAFPKTSKRRLRSLKTLDLSGCKNITDRTVLLFANRCPVILSLNLSGCPEITKDACKTLIRSAKLLTDLKVRFCDHIPAGSLEIPVSERASKAIQISY